MSRPTPCNLDIICYTENGMKKFVLPQKTKQQLKRLGVTALYLFGSRAQGLAGPLSDYDFGVLVKDAKKTRDSKLYLKLYDILSPLCPRTLKNDVIDIIFLNQAPLELKFHIIKRGRVLFDANPRTRLNFEEKTMLEYCDYRPMLNMFDKIILASL